MMRKMGLHDWTLKLTTQQGGLWAFLVFMNAPMGISKQGGNRLDFMSGNSLVDGIFERSTPKIELLVALHPIYKDYRQT